MQGSPPEQTSLGPEVGRVQVDKAAQFVEDKATLVHRQVELAN
jgi:hypothetical protein